MTQRRGGECMDSALEGADAPANAMSPSSDEFFTTHWQAINSATEEIVVSTTLDGIVRSWNVGAERQFGFRADEMVGQHIRGTIPSEHHAREEQLLARVRAGEHIVRYEATRMARGDLRFDVSICLSPIRDRLGAIVGALIIGHEISARRQTEAALREEAHALETLNRTGQTVASHLDLANVVQAVTDAATELAGAAFGAFFYNVISEAKESYLLYALSGAPREAFERFPMPRATDVFGPTFRGEGPVRSDDIRQDPRYGRNAPYSGMPSGHLPVRSYLAIPVVSRSGEVLGGLFFGHPEPGIFTERAERLVLGIAAQAAVALDNARLYEGVQRELVARRQADQALRESESRLRNVLAEREGLLESERAARSEAEHLSQMKDEFLATLSHELRTPLNSIQGWVSVLRSAQTSAQDRARGLETIDRNVRAQAQLVSDLLDMSRIISGKIHLEVQTVYLHEVINAALDSVLPSAEAKGIRVTRVLDTEINPARGDPDRLQQVLWNLLSNAVKFTPRGGRIQVILERVNSHAEIVVEDSGIGIQPEFLPHVFDRFRQADAGISRRYSGLGIGLSIVKSLVELHGGSVRVKSPGENQGSTFSVSLPIPLMSPDDRRREHRRPIAASAHDADDAIELPRLDGINVLLVDDDADSLALAVRVLEERGAHTVAVGDGIEALKVLRERHFDILLSDIGMPDIDGYELIQRVREFDHERGRAIPAIALTAYARLDDRQRSLLAGYQMHIAKPVDARELIAGIASLLRVSR